ncbi:MAG: hypothetical protein HFG36_06815 [Eubacterium sp.]|nr:hypothetical protein [Eubacterium sp.]
MSSRWKKAAAVLCLMGCLVLEACPEVSWIYAAGQERTDSSRADSAEEDSKQGMSDSGGMSGFSIDNQNIYEGMENSYAGGYVPRIEKNKAVIVLPLQAKRKLLGNKITVTLRFGESENHPFVYKNYEKAVSFGYHKTGKQGQKTGCYLVTFQLDLKKERCNGSYPVTLSASGQDESGNEISQEFMVYVTITDGKKVEGDARGEADEGGVAGFVIDNQNVYKGMEKSYSRGYVPNIGNDNAVLVLPLQAKHKISGNQITAALKFGEGENLPFVHKNYEKEVKSKYYKVGKQGKKVGRYLVSFNLKLKKDRYNGSYPVIVTVSGQDESGNEISQEFTVYVTITDGKKAGEAEDAQEGGEDTVAKFAPKVMIDSYQFSRKKILCGEKFTAKITLHNTSNSEPVKNMMVSVTPGENVELLGRTGSSYVQELAAGGSCDLSFRFRVNASAPRGQYSIGVTMDYADAKGGTHTAEGAMKVSAEQSVQIQIPPVSMAKTIQLGETVELQTQVMNLGKGKLYNVRATLEADGLTPSGAAFIGDVEAGTSMSGSMEVTAEGLTGTNLYGTTQGKITFYYADEAGNEMTQEQTFETDILSPLSGENEAEPEEDTRQWWVIMAVIVALLILAAVIFFVRRSKRIQTGGGDVNE